jgi:hypothetical protein
MQTPQKIDATQQQQKQKQKQPLFLIFFDSPKIETFENISQEFSSFRKRISHLFFSDRLNHHIALTLISQKIKDEIALMLNKIQAKNKFKKTLLEIEDLKLAFQLKNQILPQLKKEIENDNLNLKIALHNAYKQEEFETFDEKCDEYFASSLELHIINKFSKPNIIAYIGNLITKEEKSKYIRTLFEKQIKFEFYSVHINHIIASIERKKFFYLFLKDKVFATLYAPI